MPQSDKESAPRAPLRQNGDEEQEFSNITATRCRQCRRVFFPPRVICPECFVDATLEVIPLERYGVIYSLAIVRVRPPGGRAVPYAVGYVDLPELGLRVFTRFADCNLADLEIGAKVEMIADVEQSIGGDVQGYVFRLVA